MFVIIGGTGIGIGTARVYSRANSTEAVELLPAFSTLHFERLADPARTLARDDRGRVVAIMTDGARTVVLAGRLRTFVEPETTAAIVASNARVLLLPRSWSAGGEGDTWFSTWYLAARETSVDLLEAATQYLTGADSDFDARGIEYRGDAHYPGVSATGERVPGDFNDYLGVAWTFSDGATRQAPPTRSRALSSAGLVRLVFGYRGGMPLSGHVRDPSGMAPTVDELFYGAGATIAPVTGAAVSDLGRLQPGDLLFFDTDPDATLDQVAIYLGVDQRSEHRFIMSRREADGPTMGDTGGRSVVDRGRFASALRAVKRI
ncbi:hypothetical protein [Tsukamurella paurometabola]|uniref:hypothetical protein n=1 Tax=Tsukamurella paurometabola TaxID=2061 RepID=UPI0011C07BE2|nr:hypothetical protein [Tsukamurella paurometabola]